MFRGKKNPHYDERCLVHILSLIRLTRKSIWQLGQRETTVFLTTFTKIHPPISLYYIHTQTSMYIHTPHRKRLIIHVCSLTLVIIKYMNLNQQHIYSCCTLKCRNISMHFVFIYWHKTPDINRWACLVFAVRGWDAMESWTSNNNITNVTAWASLVSRSPLRYSQSNT